MSINMFSSDASSQPDYLSVGWCSKDCQSAELVCVYV